MTEYWKPIASLEGFYEVSSLGNIRNVIGQRKTRKDPDRVRKGLGDPR